MFSFDGFDFEIKEITAEEQETSMGRCTDEADDAEIISVEEALARCMNRNGCVDMHYICDVSGQTLSDVIEIMGDTLLQDPVAFDKDPNPMEHWMLRERYMVGNLMEKLKVAKTMEKKYHRFSKNIAVLKQALPKCPTIDTIGITLGSPWILPHIYQQFCKEVLGLLELPTISYCKVLHQWKVTESVLDTHSIENTMRFGTNRISALKLVEKSLNAEIPKVYDCAPLPDKNGNAVYIINRQETLVAQEKQRLLQQEFQNWIRNDANRVSMLEKIFYEQYACIVSGQYDGSSLSLPDLSEDICLYPHQKNAVAQIIADKDVLLHHAVGSGKTWDIIIGIHELYRMGQSMKNLVVTPNNVLQDFEKAHRILYPRDRIFVVYPKDFTPTKRRETIEKICIGDFVAVYMAASSFDLISMSRQHDIDEANERIWELKSALVRASAPWEINAIKARIRKEEKYLDKMKSEFLADAGVVFEDLGITCLAVDEVHNYKNISLNTRSGQVVGMHKKGSRKCDEMMKKVQHVRRKGGHIIFATGTALTNSLSDIYVFQQYLQPETLALMGIDSFDEWINTFATKRVAFEIDVDGRNFRTMTRFAKFHNIRELISIFGGVCNVYLGEHAGMGLPKFNGYFDTVLKADQMLSDYMDFLVLRTEEIRSGEVGAHEDNLLWVTQDGRAAAIDIRLVEKEAKPDNTSTKCYACAKKVLGLYAKYPNTAQIIFCDRVENGSFHVYKTLKEHLVSMGIPSEEIAFIHDAANEKQRLALFEKVNQASLRVLIGSTAKLGIGVNVQERLIAIHHLDIPFRPADLTQREGRLIRHGNRNSEVFIFRYICEGSFDGYSWQILENKVRFIGQFMENSVSADAVDDIAETVLSYAEIKAAALGDPLLKTRCETANDLERAKIHQRQRDGELFRFKSILQQSPKVCSEAKQKMNQISCDMQHLEKYREELNMQERQAFGEELLEALKASAYMERARLFDRAHGFEIWLPAWMESEQPRIQLKGPSGRLYDVSMKEATKPLGCLKRIEYTLLHLGDQHALWKEKIRETKRQRVQAEKELKNGNPYDEVVNELILKLSEMDAELYKHTMEGE